MEKSTIFENEAQQEKSQIRIVKITENFCIPIPKEIAEKYNFSPNFEVALEARKDGVLIKKASRQEIGKRIIQLLQDGLSEVDIETIVQERKLDRCF